MCTDFADYELEFTRPPDLNLSAIITRAPDVVNEHGEELWTNLASNVALVRLKPGTYSEKHFHVITQELYSIVEGEPTMILSGVIMELHKGHNVKIVPGQVHQIFNHTKEDVLFFVMTDIPWSSDDQHFV